MAVRSVMHQAGAAVLTKLLRFPPPAVDQRTIPCPCGRQAHYRELRSKPVLTARWARWKCGVPTTMPALSQRPVSTPMSNWISKTRSPRLECAGWKLWSAKRRRFDHGRQQMETTRRSGCDPPKPWSERRRRLGKISPRASGRECIFYRAMQLDLPMVMGKAGSYLLCANGWDRNTGREERDAGGPGKARWKVSPPVRGKREAGRCVSSRRLRWDKEVATQSAIPDSTTCTGAIRRTAQEFGKRIYVEAWKQPAGAARQRKVVMRGDGAEWIWNLAEQHFPGRGADCRSVSRAPAASLGVGAPVASLMTKRARKLGSGFTSVRGCSIRGRSTKLVSALRSILH